MLWETTAKMNKEQVALPECFIWNKKNNIVWVMREMPRAADADAEVGHSRRYVGLECSSPGTMETINNLWISTLTISIKQ